MKNAFQIVWKPPADVLDQTAHARAPCITDYCLMGNVLSTMSQMKKNNRSFCTRQQSLIVLYCTVLCCFALHCIGLYCIVLDCIVLRCIVVRSIALFCMVLFCSALDCTVLCCIVYTVLYYIVLSCTGVVL